MNEVSDITKTVGYEVSGQVTQRRDAADPAYCIGEGKLDEVDKMIREGAIEVVIFTQQLSAGQIFRIGKKLGDTVRVLDRNLLILEVFDKRSATTEAKLQIELAKLRYTFSWARESIRMRGIVSEQMGRGGPGRYPYQVYESMARKRISKIEKELRETRTKKADLREHRRKAGFQTVALTGYTQSGKTTLFNRLTFESKEIGMGPFTTLSTYARKVSLPSGGVGSFIMIDSIGFIEDLSPLLLNAFHTTLNELANSDLVLLFIDSSESIDIVRRKISTCHDVMAQEVSGVPVLICLNKADLVTGEHLDQVFEETRKVFEDEETVKISAKTGANVHELLRKITARLRAPLSN
jgi:GTP-binding protein HflX